MSDHEAAPPLPPISLDGLTEVEEARVNGWWAQGLIRRMFTFGGKEWGVKEANSKDYVPASLQLVNGTEKLKVTFSRIPDKTPNVLKVTKRRSKLKT